MSKRVEIIEQEEIFKKAIFRINQARLRHERYDGTMSDEMTRLNLERGDSAAALLHNQADDTVIFTEQFRYPTHAKGPGWILEVAAGSVESGEDPMETMRRELVEEIGYQVEKLRFISKFYLSPGGTSERIWLYYASIKPTDRVGAGGGVSYEGEDIRTVVIPYQEALMKIETGDIVDAKTIIALQWLKLNKAYL